MAVSAKKVAPAPAPKAQPELSVLDNPTPNLSARAARSRPAPKLSMVDQARPKAPDLSRWAMTALEVSSAGTFLCDLDWTILYANRAALEAMESMQPILQRFSDLWSDFTPDNVVGETIEWLFSDEPAQWRKMGDPRNHPYHGIIKIGPCTCDVRVSGIRDAKGELTGYVVECEHITEKLKMEQRQQQCLTALENASTNVMIADTELNAVYMNKAVTSLLKSREAEFQKVFGASFRADALLGRCIDDFHKNPQHQRRLLANESAFPMKTRIEVGPLRVDLAVSVLKNDKGAVIGFCTEWTDSTDRLREEEEYRAGVKEIADRMDLLRGACVTELASAMEALTKGDLTIRITPRTPLLAIPPQPDLATMTQTFNDLRNQIVKAVEAYNQAQEQLTELVTKTREASDSIAQASGEVADGTNDLSQRTEEQASNLEETASSMEQMTATVKQNADNARQANQLASQAKDVAEKGGQVVNNAVTSMEEINKASKRIADIITVIDEIAFQTNLLALNAAVEAARVGEQGRGFAVVAAEVRNLAGRSATAAKEIKSLVQDSVQKVQEGSLLVNRSGQTLEEIVGSVKKVADIIAEISSASTEQAAGIEQTNRAIMQMDQITQQNAALVEEASAASQIMNDQALELQTLVSWFKVDPSNQQLSVQRPQVARASAARPAAPTQSSRTTSQPLRQAQQPVRGARQAQPPARRASAPQTNRDDDFEEF